MNIVSLEPHVDIVAAFLRAESLNPGKAFLVGPETLSYGELLDRVARLSGFFETAGLRQGERVVVATRHEVEAAVLFLALLRNGLTAVMVDPKAPAGEANRVIAASKARGIFIDAELHADWQPLSGDCCTVLIRKAPRGSLLSKLLGKRPAAPAGEAAYPELLQLQRPVPGPESVAPRIDAYILFTSGTTSRPKGVRISHGALAAHLATLTGQFGYAQSSRLLNVLPLHHADGMIQGPVVAFYNGATLYRPGPFSIQTLPILLDTVYAQRLTHFVAVPTMLALILQMAQGYEESFSSPEFHCIISTAAHLSQALWENFESRFGVRVANVYGLTETVAGSFFSGPDEASHRPGTIGRALHCRARIVDANGSDLPDGEPGELLLSGAHLMTGYFEDPAGTAEVLQDGWLRTGDLAVRDPRGFHRIVGRKKSLIIRGGFNILPEEVSESLASHPSVLEAVTFGVPDATWGEQLVSCVVPSGSDHPSEQSLFEHLRARLTPEKIPGHIHVLPELPKGPSGKVIIDQVARLVAGAPAGQGGEGHAQLQVGILNLAAASFKVPVSFLTPAACQITTPGWDSLAHLEFVVALEQEFGIALSPADIIRITSLADAERVVRSRLHG